MVTPLRVVLVGYYPPPFAGESVHVRQLATLLRADGARVQVISLNRDAAPSDECTSDRSRLRIGYRLWEQLDSSTLFHMHANGHNRGSWCYICGFGQIARLRRARSILTIHSGLFPRFVAGLDFLNQRLARKALSPYQRIVCVNDDIARAMRHLGVPPGRLQVLPAFLGVPPVTALSSDDAERLEPFDPLIVAVGGGDADPELGMPPILDAVEGLLASIPRLGVVFVGWKVGTRLTDLVARRRLGNHAVVLGGVDHARCLALLGAADLVVRSTFADGDAISVREAIALGVPVVASDTTARPSGVTLFAAGDVCDLRAKMAARLTGSRETLGREPTIGNSARELLQLYRDVAGSRAGVAAHPTLRQDYSGSGGDALRRGQQGERLVAVRARHEDDRKH